MGLFVGALIERGREREGTSEYKEPIKWNKKSLKMSKAIVVCLIIYAR